jgi:hypothetical protein
VKEQVHLQHRMAFVEAEMPGHRICRAYSVIFGCPSSSY